MLDPSSLSIENLLERLYERKNCFLGYPYNLQYNYQNLLPLLQFTISNVSDPYVDGRLGLNSKSFEREVIQYFSELYGLPLGAAWGYVTSCGTEGNLHGLWMGRELYPDGILYASEDSHYSVTKAARLLRVPFTEVKSQRNGEVDYNALRHALSNNWGQPPIITLNIGTTVKGAVDNLAKVVKILNNLAIERFYIHLDAALGGLLIPFMEGATPLDFSQFPIGSIAVSGHKFIGSPIPCGIVLTRKYYVRRFEVDYIGAPDTTLTGSRSGLAAVILWEAIRQRQHQFAAEVVQCRQNAEYLRQRLSQQGQLALLNPFSTTVVFKHPAAEIAQKWQLACYDNIAHVVVMQHHTRCLLDQFLDEMDSVTAQPPPPHHQSATVERQPVMEVLQI
jgi:histidine decarboxylase